MREFWRKGAFFTVKNACLLNKNLSNLQKNYDPLVVCTCRKPAIVGLGPKSKIRSHIMVVLKEGVFVGE